MGYGKDMQSYIQIKTWFTLLGSVTIAKIGFLLKSQGDITSFNFFFFFVIFANY